jgi:DNA-binding response OmpR family regulator
MNLEPQQPKQHRLLVIDKEEAFLNSIKCSLEPDKYHVTTCNCFKKAIDKIKNEHFDLVFTDIEMPVKTGFDLISIFKNGFDETVPIVVMTGNPNLDHLTKAFHLGASDFVTKPIKFPDLEKLITRNIKKHKDKRRDFDLKHSLVSFNKSFVFTQEDCFNSSIVEFLNAEIQKNVNMPSLKKNEVYLIMEELMSNAFLHGIWGLTPEERTLEKEVLIDIAKSKLISKEANIKVDIAYCKKHDKLCLTVKDTGNGFDYKKFLEKEQNAINPAAFSGHGLFLIKTLSEKVSFHDNGSKIEVMIKINQ